MPLYIISTPIGNLSDLTERAKKILGEIDILLAEDTRVTEKLLCLKEISHPNIVSYNEFNKQKRIPLIIQLLKEQKKVGLVSSAGTPLISDPGYELVNAVIDRNLKVIAIPGVSALLTALVVSGFPPTRFIFLGFLPKYKKDKIKIFKSLLKKNELIKTVIFYDSPNRVINTLEIVSKVIGKEIPIVVCRELTKRFEEKIRGSCQEVLIKLVKRKKIKGELTVLIRLN